MGKQKFVVRNYSQRLASGVRLALIAALLILLIAAYQFGQLRAGHNSYTARGTYLALEARFHDLQAENETLQRQIAILETDHVIDQDSYQQVELELIDLQARILAQDEEISFYRGILDAADGRTGIRVQNLRLIAGQGSQGFEAALLLTQELRSTSVASGYVTLQVEAQGPDGLVLLDLDSLSVDAVSQLDFSFRYYQELRAALELPVDLKPLRIIVKVEPEGKTLKSVEQSFDWQPESG